MAIGGLRSGAWSAAQMQPRFVDSESQIRALRATRLAKKLAGVLPGKGAAMFAVDETLVGRKSEPVVNEIEKGAVRRFMEALGDTDALGLDEEAARAAGYRSLRAPPTFAVTLRRNPPPGLVMPRAGTIHGEQHFTYGAPIVAGDRIAVSSWLEDVKVRNGSRGPMTLVTVATEGINQDGVSAFVGRAILIVTEAAAR